MAQFQTDTITPLYWAESSGFITGRDSMGIQNSSVVVYVTLLPGITNVTERIRYYGFHCWILAQYDNLKEEKLSYKHQYDFIRRAELVIAFLMQHQNPDFVAIPGKAFAGDFFNRFEEDGFIDLSSGADKGKYLKDDKGDNRSYWKYSSGAMGQYYAGALLALSLIKIRENYYLLQPKGQELAEAFAASIDPDTQSTLLSIIKNGELNYADLSKLKAFDISDIDPSSSEWKTYIDLLFNKDGQSKQTFQRRDTLLHYLRINKTSFPRSNWLLGEYFFQYTSEVSYEPYSASLGWYVYYTQELIHYAIEHIFNTMLLLMKKDFYEINSFVDQQVELLEEALNKNKIDPRAPLRDWLTLNMSGNEKSPIQIKLDLNQSAKEQAFSEVYYQSLLLITQTYQKVKGDIKAFENYLLKNGIQGRRGNIIEIQEYLNRNAGKSIILFFRTFLRSILNDHQIVAFNKMGNGEAQVHKFLIEHNHLIQINHIAPRMTNPRLGSVKNMLEDLSLLDKELHRPTSEGIALLEKYHWD